MATQKSALDQVLDVDFVEAERFLSFLDPEENRWCFTPVPEGGAPSRSLFGDIRNERFQNKLQRASDKERANNAGVIAPTAIYVSVNKFKADADNRRIVSLESVRALSADFDFSEKSMTPDGELLRDLYPDRDSRFAYVRDIGFHIIVETSPGKFHCYVKVKPGLLSPGDAADFNRGLVDRWGCDRGSVDAVHAMRLPGAWHRKGEPFQSRIVHLDESLPIIETEDQITIAGRLDKRGLTAADIIMMKRDAAAKPLHTLRGPQYSLDDVPPFYPAYEVDDEGVARLLVGADGRQQPWQNALKPGYDRSNFDQTIANWCFSDGLPIEVADVVMRHYRGIVGDEQGKLERDDYVRRSWAKAMSFVRVPMINSSTRMRKQAIDILMGVSGGGSKDDTTSVMSPMPEKRDEGISDDALARRIANHMGGSLRYVPERGFWVLWDGQKWQRIDKGHAKDLCRDVLWEIADQEASDAVTNAQNRLGEVEPDLEAIDDHYAGLRQELADARKVVTQAGKEKDAKASAEAARLDKEVRVAKAKRDAMTKMSGSLRKVVETAGAPNRADLQSTKRLNDVFAQFMIERREGAEVATDPEVWDAKKDYYAGPEGVFDIRTGDLIDNPRDAYCSRSTAVMPAPKGTKPERWLAFLDEVFDGDKELIDYLHRYVGYGLTGHTRDHSFLFAYGRHGRNGKGVLFGTLGKILGDYAATPDSKLFTMEGESRHGAFVAVLDGVRFAVSEEVPDHARWNIAMLKKLSAGDKLQANYMRQDPFEFYPQATVVIVSNHKPTFTTVDGAIRSRFRFLNFEKSFAGREDKHLAEKLEEEWPAILRWIMDGALLYYESGLPVPEKVLADTNDYLEDANIFSQWLQEHTLDGCEMIDSENEIYWHNISNVQANYREFCRDAGFRRMSPSAFKEALTEAGFPKTSKRFGGRTSAARRCRGPLKDIFSFK